MKTEHWTGEMPCNINGFRKTESLIKINNCLNLYFTDFLLSQIKISCACERNILYIVSLALRLALTPNCNLFKLCTGQNQWNRKCHTLFS